MRKRSGTSEDSSSLCSIIHHLWLQNSLGSPWGYTLYPDGKTPVPLRGCLLSGPQHHCVPLEYTTRSLLYQAHIRAIKNKSKRSGTSHLLMRCSLALSETTCWIKKLHFKEWQPTFNLRETMAMVAMMMMMMMTTSWQSSPRQFAVLHASFCSLQSAGIFTSSLAVIQWDLRMLICTSINSYLRDKSKHVCFFVCVFFFPLFSTPQRHLWALW